MGVEPTKGSQSKVEIASVDKAFVDMLRTGRLQEAGTLARRLEAGKVRDTVAQNVIDGLSECLADPAKIDRVAAIMEQYFGRFPELIVTPSIQDAVGKFINAYTPDNFHQLYDLGRILTIMHGSSSGRNKESDPAIYRMIDRTLKNAKTCYDYEVALQLSDCLSDQRPSNPIFKMLQEKLIIAKVEASYAASLAVDSKAKEQELTISQVVEMASKFGVLSSPEVAALIKTRALEEFNRVYDGAGYLRLIDKLPTSPQEREDIHRKTFDALLRFKPSLAASILFGSDSHNYGGYTPIKVSREIKVDYIRNLIPTMPDRIPNELKALLPRMADKKLNSPETAALVFEAVASRIPQNAGYENIAQTIIHDAEPQQAEAWRRHSNWIDLHMEEVKDLLRTLAQNAANTRDDYREHGLSNSHMRLIAREEHCPALRERYASDTEILGLVKTIRGLYLEYKDSSPRNGYGEAQYADRRVKTEAALSSFMERFPKPPGLFKRWFG